jgi:hypothetical protein
VPTKDKKILVRPKATVVANNRLSPHVEGDEEQSELDASSTGDIASVASGASNDQEERLEGDFTKASDEDIVLMSDKDEEEDEVVTDEIIDSLEEVVFLGLNESELSPLQYIGVMNDNRSEVFSLPKPKRVLSYSILTMFNASISETERPKRARNDDRMEMTPVSLAEFSLGPTLVKKNERLLQSLYIREKSPVSSNDEELDRQLGEELDLQDDIEDRDETPVPLLTPPGSPLTIDWDGSKTMICEWPSNLIIESALQAVNELRPMSPTSLENLERDDQGRFTAEFDIKGNTTLTPLFRGIQVGIL